MEKQDSRNSLRNSTELITSTTLTSTNNHCYSVIMLFPFPTIPTMSKSDSTSKNGKFWSTYMAAAVSRTPKISTKWFQQLPRSMC
uniref:Uncharacterized protein n=1 Tax=Arundo donax TaxID=35708 RepID=A0A0A9G7N0_ARUDO